MSARALTLLWFVLTLIGLGWPGADLPEPPVIGFDKVVHVAIFATGCILALTGWPGMRLLVIAALLVFAPLAEVWQAVLPTGRDANVPDAIANAVGVAVGWAVWRTWVARRRTRS